MGTTRTTLGPAWNEGARLTWKALAAKGWTPTDLQRRLKGPSGKPLGGGVVNRWLYGDMLPSIPSGAQIQALLDVPLASWARGPAAPFVPPAARKAKHAPRRSFATESRKLGARSAARFRRATRA